MKKFLKSQKAKKYGITEELLKKVLQAPSLQARKIEKIKQQIATGEYQIHIQNLIELLLTKNLKFCF